MEFAPNVNLLKDEGAYRVLAAAQALEKEGHHVVHLEIGQPGFKVRSYVLNLHNPARSTDES